MIILNILMIILLFTAFFLVFTKDLLNSVIILFIFSSILVVVFLVLQSPDVAMAEAVIGSGLMIAFFVVTISKTKDWKND